MPWPPSWHPEPLEQGEDGIIEFIMSNIGETDKYYVEFGVQDCSECNTRAMRERGWTGACCGQRRAARDTCGCRPLCTLDCALLAAAPGCCCCMHTATRA